MCGSAFKNKGVQRLLDSVVNLLPSPLDVGSIAGLDPKDKDVEKNRKPELEDPFSALAFKIMTDYFANGVDIRNETYLKKTISKFNNHNKLFTLNENNHLDYKELFLNFDFINGVPVFIFNDCLVGF